MLEALNATDTVCLRPVRNRSATVYAVGAGLTSLSGLLVVQRLVTKLLSRELSIGLDDWSTLVAMAIQASATALLCIPGTANGLGQDIWTLRPQQITDFLYYLYIFTAIYFVNLAIGKLSFLLFYLRIFPTRTVRQALWVTAVLVTVWGIVFLFLAIFQCSPISYYWNRWDGDHEGSCVNPSHIAWANSAFSICLDIWMIGIPLSQIRTMNMNWRKKLSIGAMFCVGLL